MTTPMRCVALIGLLGWPLASAQAKRPPTLWSRPEALPVLQQAAAPPDTTQQDSTRRRRRGATVRVSGYTQVFYKGRRDANADGFTEPGVFRVQRVRLNFKGDLTRHVSYDVEIDPRAPDITGILRDAFISLDYLPRHEIRIGQQKTLFGHENPTSSSRLFTVNRSEVSDFLSRGINLRDIGIGVVGSVRLGGGFRLEDAVTLVNGSGLNVQADSTARKNVWGRLGVRYRSGDLTLRLGVSGASGDQQEPADSGPPPVAPFTFTFTRYGADFVVDHPRVHFAAEYIAGDDRAPASVPGAGGHRSGYYAILVGKTPWGFGPLVRYDAVEEFQRWTVGGYVGLPADDVSLLANYEVFRDALGKHDDRFYLRLQVRY